MGNFGLIFFLRTIPRARGFQKRTFSGVSLWRRFSQNRLRYDSEIFTGSKNYVYAYAELGYKRYLKYFCKQSIFNDFFYKSADIFANLCHIKSSKKSKKK